MSLVSLRRHQEEAAAAYDMAAIEFRGPNAVTNFDISNYTNKLKKILPEIQVIQEEAQVKEETTPELLNKEQADEAHDHHADANQDVQPSIPKTESIDAIDSQAIVVMDPTEEHEHPWDLCLDIGFNVLEIPDIPLEKASEVFDYKGFEDDIECIFDTPFGDNEFLPDAMSGNGGRKIEADSSVGQDSNGDDASPSPSSSSSLSTSTSVCSNM
ncbi:UNVERIFIED_CONTAM: Ethylene-responsive transcription factor WRI1 [Sesamum radiatum]|uniref:Ethylene-responsive transcription factor WRI1 n=1 Tax=Sesamum radiatum TaxID=300843 RepID=A0AAW2VN30_SESRA